MAAKLSPAERDEKSAQAYGLSLRGWHIPAIAVQLQISERTIGTYLRRERERVRVARQGEHNDLLEQFLAEQDADRAESYRYGTATTTPPSSRASHLANATSASVNKAKALGLFVERHDVTSGGQPLGEYLRGMTDAELDAIIAAAPGEGASGRSSPGDSEAPLGD